VCQISKLSGEFGQTKPGWIAWSCSHTVCWMVMFWYHYFCVTFVSKWDVFLNISCSLKPLRGVFQEDKIFKLFYKFFSTNQILRLILGCMINQWIIKFGGKTHVTWVFNQILYNYCWKFNTHQKRLIVTKRVYSFFFSKNINFSKFHSKNVTPKCKKDGRRFEKYSPKGHFCHPYCFKWNTKLFENTDNTVIIPYIRRKIKGIVIAFLVWKDW